MLVSTKTLAAIEIRALRIARPRPLQAPWRACQVLLHGRLVIPLVEHLLPEHLADETGETGLAFGGANPGPTGNLLVQGDGDVLHYTILVLHEIRVNLGDGHAYV